MWQRIALFSAAALVALLARPLSAGEPDSSGPSLWASSKWVRLEIVGGKVAVLSTRCGNSLAIVEPSESSERRESLAVQAHPPAVQVNYEWNDGERQITLLVDERGNLAIDRRGDAAASELHYSQPSEPGFGDRQSADQALRDAGQPVLAFLRGQKLAELAPEQRRRIRAILADVADTGADSPERVADWLLDDRGVWLALLNRGELEHRIAAAEHLSKLCRRNLPFDPSASPESRQAQMADLR